MLKFLTHKLRTHSLNEENASEKVEERDSGTESDDEADRDNGDFCTDVIMKWNDITDISMSGEACACAPTPPRLLPDPEPDHLYDHHSSEEELEVINGAPASNAGSGAASGACGGAVPPESRRRGASSPPPSAPEKRKWPAQPYLDSEEERATRAPSDDDEDKVETPVRFRTSPPLEALKPRRAGGSVCACTGPSSVRSERSERGERAERSERAPASPRRRRMPLPPPRRHRPALDFDKMQQLRVGGGVRSWRAVGGAHGGELSVFCW